MVRDGERLLVAQNSTEPPDHSLSACPFDAPTTTKCHLIWYFRELASSLPQEEWTDQQPRRYVPARYAICVTGERALNGSTTVLADPASVVALLPSPAPSCWEAASRLSPTSTPATRASI